MLLGVVALDPPGLGSVGLRGASDPGEGQGVSLVEELDRTVRPLNPGITHTEGVSVADSVQ